jgi:hypothetical protein
LEFAGCQRAALCGAPHPSQSRDPSLPAKALQIRVFSLLIGGFRALSDIFYPEAANFS